MFQNLHLAWICIVLFASSFGNGFVLNTNPFQKILSQFTEDDKEKTITDSEKVLKELGIQASTTPRPFNAEIEQLPTLASAAVSSLLRLGSGVFGLNYQFGLERKDESRYSVFSIGNQQIHESGYYNAPKQPLIFYELEADADCKLVREACSMLSLTVTVFPCPKNGQFYRKEVPQRFSGLEQTFPMMFDPNTKAKLATSSDIVEYLFVNYGRGKVPWTLDTKQTWPKTTAKLGVEIARLGAGGKYKYSRFTPGQDKLLTLWAYEGSPFCKIVRETLTELEIPHNIIYTPRGSPNRQVLYEQVSRFQAPFLQDPNTGVNLFESAAIVEYLEKQYGLKAPVDYF
jgi:hypothetical protein